MWSDTFARKHVFYTAARSTPKRFISSTQSLAYNDEHFVRAVCASQMPWRADFFGRHFNCFGGCRTHSRTQTLPHEHTHTPTYTASVRFCAVDGRGRLTGHAHVSVGSQTRQCRPCMGVLVCSRCFSKRAADFHTRTLVLIWSNPVPVYGNEALFHPIFSTRPYSEQHTACTPSMFYRRMMNTNQWPFAHRPIVCSYL